MCGYVSDKVLFIKKENQSAKILQRHFDCGAYDSDSPKYEFIKIIHLNSFLNYVEKIDTIKMTKSEWIRKAEK